MEIHYDSGLFWDTPGLTWDAPAVAQPKGPMIRVRKTMRSRAIVDMRSQLQGAYDGMNGNPNFPNPNPTMPVYLGKLQQIDAKLTEITETETLLRTLRQQRDNLFEEAILMYSQNGSYVENVSGDNRAMGESSGYEVVVETPQPPAPLKKPTNVVATTGENDGELELRWEDDTTVDAYEVQSSPDPITSASWVHAATTGLSRLTLSGLPSLAKRWARVRAVRGNEYGPWSDPACAVVT